MKMSLHRCAWCFFPLHESTFGLPSRELLKVGKWVLFDTWESHVECLAKSDVLVCHCTRAALLYLCVPLHGGCGVCMFLHPCMGACHYIDVCVPWKPKAWNLHVGLIFIWPKLFFLPSCLAESLELSSLFMSLHVECLSISLHGDYLSWYGDLSWKSIMC